ncbi:MAG: beta-lactamase family protein [Anaerolineales bacterium]|nr:beta-lactamase family protein [Anaerolineales bacterium]
MDKSNAPQSILDKQICRNHIYNIVAAVQSTDRRLDFIGAAGAADPQTGTAMTPNTPYFIASITKMYTAAIIMQLYQEQRFQLETPASEYLPPSLIERIHVYKGTDYSARITIQQLLNQTSGLADHEADKSPDGTCLMENLKAGHDRYISTEEAMDMVRELSPHFPPGTPGKAYYSNANYRLLGMLIEAVTSKSMGENYQDRICEPLGLQHTYLFDWTNPRPGLKPAAIYLKDNPVCVPKYLSSNLSDGGLVSTATECMQFLRAFFEGRLFDRSLLETMQHWNRIFFPLQYGSGLMYFKLPRFMSPLQAASDLVGHSGSTGSFAFFSPSLSVYLAGTINQINAPSTPFTLMMKLLRAAG